MTDHHDMMAIYNWYKTIHNHECVCPSCRWSFLFSKQVNMKYILLVLLVCIIPGAITLTMLIVNNWTFDHGKGLLWIILVILIWQVTIMTIIIFINQILKDNINELEKEIKEML